MELQRRKYPIGIQTFSEIVRNNYVYVDKTDLVWKMVHYAKFIFMSRPRRFGKSLLTSTLESYFKGERDLFAGLKIADMEQEWTQYPTFHFDLSTAKHLNEDGVRNALGLQVGLYERTYGSDPNETSPGMRLGGLIRRAYEQSGKQVAVIIDEYDAPLLDVLHDDTRLEVRRETLQEFYQPLKANEQYIKFCFITGITKFSQLSIFSTINNIKNVTLIPRFSTICGFTEDEVLSVFAEDLRQMAEVYGLTPDEMYMKIKFMYDGYRFSSGTTNVFNPFSLLNAFIDQEMNNYWFESGTPTYLIRQLQHFGTDITSLEKLEVPAEAFDQPTENMQNALPLLYQSGYLTIKDYNHLTRSYVLSFPNEEVRVGYVKGLLPIYVGVNSCDVQMGFAAKFWTALLGHDIDLAMSHMQSYLASIPYVEGFKKKLAEAANAEGFYEYTFYLIFSMLNVYVQTQVKVAGGRVDVVVFMHDTIYVIELKAGGSAEDALRQIDEKGYADAYKTDGRRIVRVGVSMNKDSRTVEDWKVVSESLS